MDGRLWGRMDGDWHLITGGGAGIEDAPSDQVYTRIYGSWVPLSPIDGGIY